MNPDRLDLMCAQDMAEAGSAAYAAADRLDRASAFVGPETWTGPPADRWSTEFAGRHNAMRRFFDQLEQERHRLVQQARTKVAQERLQ